MPGSNDLLRKLICLALITVSIPVGSTNCQAQSIDDQYALAAGFYSRAQWPEAKEAFDAVIARFPGSDQAHASHFFLGEALVQMQQYPAAYVEYQTFLKLLPNHRFSPRAKFRMGECAYRTQRLSQAAELLESFSRTYPHHELQEFALTYLGQVRLLRNEPQLAQRVFESALQLYPQSSMSNESRFGLASALQAQGAYAEALRFYQFIATQPGNVLSGSALKQIGIMDFAQAYYENAQSNLQAAKARLTNPKELTETTYWLARSETALGNLESALEHYESIANTPTDPVTGAAILFDGAVVAAKLNNSAQAKRWLSRLRKNWPESPGAEDALRMQIDVAYRNGDRDEAMVWIGQFAEEYPESESLPSVLEFAGRIHYQRKEYDETVETFQQLLNDFGDRDSAKTRQQVPVWHYFAGLGHIGLKHYQLAADQLRLVDIAHQDAQFKASVALARASALIGLGKNQQAIPLLQEYLGISPDGRQALQARAELAIACAVSGQWDGADAAMKDLRRNHEGQHQVLETAQFLAESAYKSEKHQYAESWFEIMTETGNPKDFVTRGLSGLAWARMESSQSEKALATFDRLLNEYPDSQFAAEAAMARGKFLEENGEHRQAADMYRLVYTRFGNSPLADVARLRCAYNRQKLGDVDNLIEAKSLLTRYLQAPHEVPAKDEALYQLAWVYLDLNHPEHGQKRFEELSREYPNSRFWVDATYRVAENAVLKKDYAKAGSVLKQLIGVEAPAEIMTRALYLQGQIAAENNDWAVVSESMSRLLDKTADPSMSLKANYWLAESLYQQDQFNSSGDIFHKLVGDPNLSDQQFAPWIYLRSAQCEAFNEKWMTAIEMAERGKRKFPGFKSDFEFDFVRGRALAATGRLEDARQAYQNVIDSPAGGATETAAIAQWRIGESFFHQEDYKQAILAYYKVDSMFSHKRWRAAALIQAGKCQEHLGNWKQAAKLYKQLIDQFPDSQYRSDAEKRMQLATQQAQLEQPTTR